LKARSTGKTASVSSRVVDAVGNLLVPAPRDWTDLPICFPHPERGLFVTPTENWAERMGAERVRDFLEVRLVVIQRQHREESEIAG
jgi:hypothetical protein